MASHEAVFFNAEDLAEFDSEFDVDEPWTPVVRKTTAESIPPSSPTPVLPKHRLPDPVVASNGIPDSSAALPWSSSPPIPQCQPFAASSMSRRTAQPQQIDSRPGPSIANETQNKPTKEDPPSRFTKRRLPWLDTKEEEFCEEISAKAYENRSRRRPETYSNPIKTPIKPATMPWNATTSTMKAARQEHKVKSATQKRSMSSMANDGEPEGKKQKSEISPVFLSTEQKNVLAMVRDNGKSVFFTGSAG